MNRFVFSKVLATAAIGAAVASTRISAAEPAPPPEAAPGPSVDVTQPVDIRLPPDAVPHRMWTVEWNPLALFVQKISANVIVVPRSHHALVLSPYYTYASTAPYATNIDAGGNPLVDSNGNQYTLNVPSSSFRGVGTEIGYRYYYGHRGPRGLFWGPSLLLAYMNATAYNGTTTSFGDFGVSADVGYQFLVADAVSISVGGGAQYNLTSRAIFGGTRIPDQQWPASIYSNNGFRPRFLLSLGYSF
jgi:hypothetical protein